MKKKIFAFLAVFAVALSTVGFGFAETKKAKTNPLLALLPASDAVVTIDAKRMFDEALPQILAGNQPMLTDILGKFEEIKTRTGVDYKQFQHVAVGIGSIKTAATGYDFEPVVIARGQFNAASLLTTAKTAAAGKYREEKIGERTVYVFSPQAAVEQGAGKFELKSGSDYSKFAGIIGKLLPVLNKEMALTSYDNNTLVIGSLVRVRETLDAKTRVSPEVLSLVARKPNAIVSFGANLPTGLAPFFELDDDNLGKSLAGIRQMSGAMDVAGGSAIVSAVAKTSDAEQAKGLKDTLVGFQGFAGILKGSKREDQKIYGRMLENVKVGQVANEVTLDLQVPQTDINVILGAKK